MATPLVSISYCACHTKMDVGISGEDHAQWLLNQVTMLQALVDWPLIVACTGWPGILSIENTPTSRERDVLWQVFKRTRAIVGIPENPGHQSGAAQCIRIALETACNLDFPYLIHTAEDVVPRRGILREMFLALEEEHDYAGEWWYSEPPGLNTQFFGCRPSALINYWDSATLYNHVHIEGYMRHLIQDHHAACYLFKHETMYYTTHHHHAWRAAVKSEHGFQF